MSWLDNFPGAQTVWTAASDFNGQARGKRLPANRAHGLFDGTAKMPLSAIGLDIFGDDVANSPLVFDSGDKDGFLRPTERGAVPMPWVRGRALLLPMSMEHGPGRPFSCDPRHALACVLGRFSNQGLCVEAATEVEFFLLDDDAPTTLAERLRVGGDILGLRSLEVYDKFLSELYEACGSMGIPAETATSESGSSQFEVTLTHGDAMTAADNTWLFKMLAKGLAHKHGMIATFMAKPDPEDAGTGMHMHFSVLGTDGKNVFDDGTAFGSSRLRQAVAGCLDAMRDATLIFAPHKNSYDRLVPGAHAPTGVCWGYENRTAAVRIPDGPGVARRIEHRVAGGDVNPYLLFAAVLGGAINGIEDEARPPAPIDGNAYEANVPQMAENWKEAISLFEESEVIKRIFGHELVKQFALTKRQELSRVSALSTADQKALYLDRV
ncbi:MAG: glutamine synthetase family protein [Pseudomonadota bacterium]